MGDWSDKWNEMPMLLTQNTCLSAGGRCGGGLPRSVSENHAEKYKVLQFQFFKIIINTEIS